MLGSLDLGVLGIILESGTGMLYGTGNRSYIVQCPYQWYNGIYESLGGLIGLWEKLEWTRGRRPC